MDKSTKWRARSRDQAQGPLWSSHKPLDGLSSQWIIGAQLNLTNDHEKKEAPHLKHVLRPFMLNLQHTVGRNQSLKQSWKKRFQWLSVAKSQRLRLSKRWLPGTAASCWTQSDRRGETGKKRPIVSLYVDELPGQNCQFSDQIDYSIQVPT